MSDKGNIEAASVIDTSNERVSREEPGRLEESKTGNSARMAQMKDQILQNDSSLKIPLVKSSFVHFSECPRKMLINMKDYSNLVLTMELI